MNRLSPRLPGACLVLAILASCGPRHTPQDCMERAMYFESNRSSRDGMIAVGSVVMNRLESGRYADDVCGVVAQKNQFAPGVMTKKMNLRTAPLIREAASAVLAGERHPLIADAQFFHTATYRAGYDNMHYVLTAGGNAFYEKRKPELVTQPVPLAPTEGLTGPRLSALVPPPAPWRQ
jgi:spore germination cell wall hydrolase CwlJ-like protein